MKAFREAIEAALGGTGNFDAVERLLADDVVFTSPVAFKPYPGRSLTAAILRGVGRVFTDFHYVREINDEPHSALIFEAKVGDVSVNGCDFITVNGEGLISELTVMVRPLKGAHALADAMAAQFDQILKEATA
ncbi:MAG TPA: nuclear transport factor 2 family protein [Aeromicrobium sp.]|nr:nuclear transport factor 2 family protein [Aeromicrobium sp.]